MQTAEALPSVVVEQGCILVKLLVALPVCPGKGAQPCHNPSLKFTGQHTSEIRSHAPGYKRALAVKSKAHRQ